MSIAGLARERMSLEDLVGNKAEKRENNAELWRDLHREISKYYKNPDNRRRQLVRVIERSVRIINPDNPGDLKDKFHNLLSFIEEVQVMSQFDDKFLADVLSELSISEAELEEKIIRAIENEYFENMPIPGSERFDDLNICVMQVRNWRPEIISDRIWSAVKHNTQDSVTSRTEDGDLYEATNLAFEYRIASINENDKLELNSALKEYILRDLEEAREEGNIRLEHSSLAYLKVLFPQAAKSHQLSDIAKEQLIKEVMYEADNFNIININSYRALLADRIKYTESGVVFEIEDASYQEEIKRRPERLATN